MLKKSNCAHCKAVTSGAGTYCRKCSKIYFPQPQIPLIERLQRKTIINGECWEWAGKLNANGYGELSISNGTGRKRSERAHRISYKLHNPDWDGLTHVLHRCDNRKCWNPEHLFHGTQEDNLRDMVNKNRHPRGAKHGISKLTDDDVRFIRSSPLGSKLLSKKLGCTPSNVDQIKWGNTWRHVNA